MGLKARLLTAFATIILFPVVTVMGMFAFLFFSMEEMTVEQKEEMDAFITSINHAVINHSEHLHDPAAFYRIIEPLIRPYNVEIIVSSEDNETLFTSSDLDDLDSSSYFFTMRQSQVQTLKGEILNIEMKSESIDLAATKTYHQIIVRSLIGIGSGFLTLVVLIVGWTVYISRTILNPLKQIYSATEEMQEGNLDYEIKYNRKDEIGKFIHGFNLMRDHIKQAMDKQRQYEDSRKELIATISHDLRTPLQSIKGYVEGIRDGIVQDEEMEKRYLNIILSKTEQLDRLIEDLFEFSKLELEQLNMESQLVNSENFFSNVLWNAETDMAHKGVELIVKGPIPSVVIYLDQKRIEQVLTNLIDNAVRYGGTKIEVEINEVKDKGKLEIHLRDNGYGISALDLPHIFNRFYRGEKSRSRELGGTGLGLSIVKSIVEAHNGTITAESEKGTGSVFSFSLPFD